MIRPIRLGLLTLLMVLGGVQGAAADTSSSGVVVSAPAANGTDTSLAVRVRLPGNVAAVEGRVLHAAEAASLVGVAPAGGGVALSPEEVTGGSSFGAYKLKPRGGFTTIDLVLAPTAPGSVDLRVVVDAAADAAGNRIPLTADRTATVSLGRGTQHFAAPAGAGRQLPARAAAGVRDLFADGVVGRMDLDAARAAWAGVRSTGACTSPREGDANGDGCVDIVDLQALEAAQGRRVGELRGTTADNRDLTRNSADPAAGEGGGVLLVYTVTSASDNADARPGDGICGDSQGRCTLRAAITESNWWSGDNRIEFNINGTAPVLIQMSTTAMALIKDQSGGLVIDGYTQPGSRVNTATSGSNAIPGIELRGTAGNPRDNGLFITSANNTIRGFLFTNHYRAVYLDGAASHHNHIVGNWFGFTAAGAVHGYRGNNGIRLNNGAHENFIGTPAPADRNVIGNFTHGLDFYGPGTDDNVVQNNLLCTTPNGTGTAACATGIDLNFGPKRNVFGGIAPNEKNVIGPTSLNGIEVSHGWDPDRRDTSDKWQNNDNRVVGNWIGFRGDGSYSATFRSGQNSPNSNDANGVNAYDGSNRTIIENNWIASVWDGVNTMSPNTTGTIIRNNLIGESPLGQPAPLNRYGVNVRTSTKRHFIEGNIIRNAAVGGVGLTQKDVLWVRISRNVITDTNGTAIFLAVDPNNPNLGANNLLASPVITAATATQASGRGVAGATVEVYRASRPAGQSGLPVAFLGSGVVAGNGSWTVPISAAVGDRITALQIATSNNTSRLGTNVIVGNQPSVIARDSFGRNLKDAWGSADIGGAYALNGSVSNYDVASGRGTMTTGVNQARQALLGDAAGRDVDMRVRVAVNRVATGGNFFVWGIVRRNGTNEYRARLLFQPGGTLSLAASYRAGSTETLLAPAVAVPGTTYSAGSFIWLRVQATGADPTTLRLKAWADGESEPGTWLITTTDTRAALQVAGSVGLRSFVGSSVTGGAVVFGFDDLAVEPE